MNRFLAILAFGSLTAFAPGLAAAQTTSSTMAPMSSGSGMGMGMKKHHRRHHKMCRDASGKFMKCPKSAMSGMKM